MRALVKLEQVLPAHLRRRVQALQRRPRRSAPRRGPTVDPQCLTLDRRRLPRPRAAALRLHAAATARRAGATSSRTRSSTSAGAGTSSPGTAGARTGARSGSTGSSAPPAPAGASSARELPAGRTTPRSSAAPRGARARYEARVTVQRPRRRWRKRAGSGPTSTPIDEDSCEYRTSDDNLDWLAMRIAMLGDDFEVHGPPS